MKLERERLVIHSTLIRLTAGVLTKADSIQDGEFEKWLKVLNGKSYRFCHGYYATRLASPKEMEWSWEKIRAREDSWFRSSKPWFQLNQGRFGHQNLIRKLSDRLSEMIEEM